MILAIGWYLRHYCFAIIIDITPFDIYYSWYWYAILAIIIDAIIIDSCHAIDIAIIAIIDIFAIDYCIAASFHWLLPLLLSTLNTLCHYCHIIMLTLLIIAISRHY